MGKRYYAKNGSLFANSDYNPQEVIVNDFSELVKITDRLEPGAIGRVVGRKQSYELNTDRVWISETGVPFITDEESEELDGGYVQFIDYDGTMIAKVKGEDVANMTKLPANPEHKGLVSQGWNWELDRIKYYMAKYPEAIMTVGQMYCTADGATHIHMNVQGRLTVPLMFQQSVSEGVTLDWGDGTIETVEGTDVVTTEHTYAAEGEYVLKMKAAEGCEMNFGDGENNLNIFGESESKKHSSFISKIYISKDIISIGEHAFAYCYKLQTLVIPEGVTNIGSYAFRWCHILQSLIIPEGVTSIGNNAFESFYTLQSLVIPEGVTSIGSNAFSSCYNLQSLVIPEGVTSIVQYTFRSCYALQSLVIPEGVTNIGNSAFSSCFDLQSLVIPEGVTSIGQQAFYNCIALQSLVILEGVTSIGQQAFFNCVTIQSLVIPEGVTSIGQQAFQNCYILQSIVFNPETPPTLSNVNAFQGLPDDCIIYVPYSEDHSILTAYQTATNWSVYAEQMVESEPDESETDEPEETLTEP